MQTITFVLFCLIVFLLVGPYLINNWTTTPPQKKDKRYYTSDWWMSDAKGVVYSRGSPIGHIEDTKTQKYMSDNSEDFRPFLRRYTLFTEDLQKAEDLQKVTLNLPQIRRGSQVI